MYRLIGIGDFGGIGSAKNVRNFRSDTDYFTVAMIIKMIVTSTGIWTSIQLHSQIN